MSVDYRAEATEIMGQKKTFYKQIIPESTCARKETANTDILGMVTEKSCDLSE